MKLECDCGETISFTTNDLPYKAHFITDQDWDDALKAIEDAIEKLGPMPSAVEKTLTYTKVQSLIAKMTRLIWQCRVCGRVYIADQSNVPHQFVPSTDEVPRELFRSSRSGG